jgi:hypothetical protein
MEARFRNGDIQVLEVATREGNVSDNLDLAIAGLGDDDLVAEVADTALNLDAVVEELLESGEVEDLVAHGLRSVDDELGCVSTAADVMRPVQDAYLLGDLLGLATTSLLTVTLRLAYCSSGRIPRARGPCRVCVSRLGMEPAGPLGGTAKRLWNQRTEAAGAIVTDWGFLGGDREKKVVAKR